MLQKLLDNKIKIFQLAFLIGFFALVRAYEDQLFYDPFIHYFKAENATSYPEFEATKLHISLFFRYFLNSIISLAVLYVIFKDIILIKFSVYLFLFFFIILIIPFLIILNYFDESQKMILFYIRRFIIQPIFIMLFIPGFYFQILFEKK